MTGVCSFCNAPIEEGEGHECASCGEEMCTDCLIGDFCPNCVEDD